MIPRERVGEFTDAVERLLFDFWDVVGPASDDEVDVLALESPVVTAWVLEVEIGSATAPEDHPEACCTFVPPRQRASTTTGLLASAYNRWVG